jgi:rfaE bifunctional protein nucleotidyltransferase chain/domain
MKIISLDNLEYTVGNLKRQGKSVVLCHGVFDLLHLGHIKYLEKAKSFGDYLVVTVTPDKYARKTPSRPRFDELQRAESLAALSCVDMVSINEWPTAVEILKKIKPNIYVKGNDYSDLKDVNLLLEKDAIESVDGKIEFTKEVSFSSSKLLNTIEYTDDVMDFLAGFPYNFRDIVEYIEQISDLSILIIGEAIIDEYQYGTSIGKSGKSPVVAFRLENSETHAGGTLAIQNHLQDFTKSVLMSGDVNVIKTRYVEDGHKLFETYSKTYHNNRKDLNIEDYDFVIVADFGNGLIDKDFRKKIKSEAKFLAVNTQRNAGNMGYHTIRKYWDRSNDMFICLDEEELRLAVHELFDRDCNIRDIVATFNHNMIVTRGSDGCVFVDGEIPAFATHVVDTTGAGDAFLSLAAPLVFLKAPMDMVGFVGNVAGAIACSYVGNKDYIRKEELYRFIKVLLHD